MDPFSLFDGVEDDFEVAAPAADSASHKTGVAAAPAASTSPPLLSRDRTAPRLTAFFDEHADTTALELSALLRDPDSLSADAQFLAATCAAGFAQLRAAVIALRAPDGAVGMPGVGVPPLEAGDARRLALSAAAESLVAATWNWMGAHGGWPHVVYREVYCMAQLARGAGLAAAANPLAGMEAVDLALILGTPGHEIDAMMDAFDRAALVARRATGGSVAAPAIVATIPPVVAPTAELGGMRLPLALLQPQQRQSQRWSFHVILMWYQQYWRQQQ